MHRFVLVALVACAAPKAAGPAWPQMAETEEDGGESIEPRPSSKVATAIEKSEEPEPAKPENNAEPATGDSAGEPQSEAKPADAADESDDAAIDDFMTSDEIVIEIEEE